LNNRFFYFCLESGEKVWDKKQFQTKCTKQSKKHEEANKTQMTTIKDLHT
jgi:hypothetical protein